MEAWKAAWGAEDPGEFDCLFALERLGFPYRNIPGQDISLHTEPIDCLWPLVELDGSAAEATTEETKWGWVNLYTSKESPR
jgi:hypothetical protein